MSVRVSAVCIWAWIVTMWNLLHHVISLYCKILAHWSVRAAWMPGFVRVIENFFFFIIGSIGVEKHRELVQMNFATLDFRSWSVYEGTFVFWRLMGGTALTLNRDFFRCIAWALVRGGLVLTWLWDFNVVAPRLLLRAWSLILDKVSLLCNEVHFFSLNIRVVLSALTFLIVEPFFIRSIRKVYLRGIKRQICVAAEMSLEVGHVLHRYRLFFFALKFEKPSLEGRWGRLKGWLLFLFGLSLRLQL